MKKHLFIFLVFLCPVLVFSQNVEVEGGIKADSIEVQSGLIKNVADPISGEDAATKAYVDLISSPCGLSIGDTHEGGIIFYLDGSGCHGLVAKARDETGDYQWSTLNQSTYAIGLGIFEGEQNTNKIISRMGVGNAPAAEQCAGLTDGGFSDWYLPSRIELDMMYENIGPGDALGLGNVGSFSSDFYWSSTEFDGNFAGIQDFASGGKKYVLQKNASPNVRAVQAF
jgi:hypothetical protein